MCRFLLVQSKKPIKPKNLLTQFAKKVKKSNAPDGDWQGDGWGIAWLDKKNQWHRQKSLLPIWEDISKFTLIPETSTFAVHARSATFPQQKGVIAFNQPYLSKKYAFVFNGFLKGVTLSNIPGRIGAEKIWYLLQQELQKKNPQDALEKVKELLLSNAKEIIALNIGLISSEDMFSLNYFTKHSDYYQLHNYTDSAIKIICSERIVITSQSADLPAGEVGWRSNLVIH